VYFLNPLIDKEKKEDILFKHRHAILGKIYLCCTILKTVHHSTISLSLSNIKEWGTFSKPLFSPPKIPLRSVSRLSYPANCLSSCQSQRSTTLTPYLHQELNRLTCIYVPWQPTCRDAICRHAFPHHDVYMNNFKTKRIGHGFPIHGRGPWPSGGAEPRGIGQTGSSGLTKATEHQTHPGRPTTTSCRCRRWCKVKLHA